MARHQSPLLLSLELLTTARSCRPNRQGHPTTVPQFSHRPILRPRVQRMAPPAASSQRRIIGRTRTLRSPIVPLQHSRTIGLSRIVGRRSSRITVPSPTARNRVGLNRIVRPQHSRTTDLVRTVRRRPSPIAVPNPTVPSQLRDPRPLRRTSVRSPNTLLLLQRRTPHRSSTRGLRLRSRKRESSRRNSRSAMRNLHNNGRASDEI